ncbi:uncharacterized protein LOC143450331 isoform X2 [Clavelina lepadiformis]|uniref:uncharacterized protein LOC143450331 isoform X2 n=1 Tax=Clavelina lepadiformis TaxID=159417 RepID=UPI0040433989
MSMMLCSFGQLPNNAQPPAHGRMTWVKPSEKAMNEASPTKHECNFNRNESVVPDDDDASNISNNSIELFPSLIQGSNEKQTTIDSEECSHLPMSNVSFVAIKSQPLFFSSPVIASVDKSCLNNKSLVQYVPGSNLNPLTTDQTQNFVDLDDIIPSSHVTTLHQNKTCKRYRKASYKMRKMPRRGFGLSGQLAKPANSLNPTKAALSRSSKKSLQKIHCTQMEELNIIESKLSSVEKLLSTTLQINIDQAVKIMKEIKLRSEQLKENVGTVRPNLSPSESDDSETESEMMQLLDVRKGRLKTILVKYGQMEGKLNCAKRKAFAISSNTTPISNCKTLDRPTSKIQSGSSGSIITSTLSVESARHCANASTYKMNLTKTISPTKSIIYIPVISTSLTANQRNVKDSRPQSIVAVTHSKRKDVMTKKASVYKFQDGADARTPPPVSLDFNGSPLRALPLTTGAKSADLAKTLPTIRTQNNTTTILQPVVLTTTVLNKTISQPCSRNNGSIVSSSSTSVRLDFCDLLKLEKIQRGIDVLSYSEMAQGDVIHKASIVGNGLILSSDLQIYTSPMTWIKAFGRTCTRINAFKKIFYNGTSLYDISVKGIIPLHKSQTTVSSLATDSVLAGPSSAFSKSDSQAVVSKSLPYSNPLDDLSSYLRKCKLQLVEDDEVFVTSSLFSSKHPWDEEKLIKHLMDEK